VQPCGVSHSMVGALAGQVTASGNGPLQGISVEAYQFNNNWWDLVDSTSTDGAGNYRLNLGEGIYRVHFFDPSGTYLGEYYNDTPLFENAASVTVYADTTTPNINAVLEPPPPPAARVEGDVSQGVEAQTGQLNLSAWNGSSMTVSRAVTCTDGIPANVNLMVGTQSFSMTETPPGSNQYAASLTAGASGDLSAQGQYTMTVQWECAAQPQDAPIGQITVQLYDPSGRVSDADTGQAVEGASVTLYRVPGAFPDTATETRDCRTTITRQGSDWSDEPAAEAGLGVAVNPDLFVVNGTQEISPTANPQVTGSQGRFAWDVIEGCWYVAVQAKGYVTKTSPLVGVPPAITDLDIALRPIQPAYLPVIVRNARTP